MDDRSIFISWFDENYKHISIPRREAVLLYAARLSASAPRLGLVSKGDVGRIHTRHLREVCAPEFLAAVPRGARVLDVGSGGGLPGIPLALLRDDLEVTLLEPRGRKVAFLERMVLELASGNLRVLPLALEEAGAREPGAWSVAVSRGLGWTPPLIRGLRKSVQDPGLLLRFGAPEVSVPGVLVTPIRPDGERAIQVWPREAWGHLPGAR